jgi:DNA phosphorothioation-dependent restriction protein DptG
LMRHQQLSDNFERICVVFQKKNSKSEIFFFNNIGKIR